MLLRLSILEESPKLVAQIKRWAFHHHHPKRYHVQYMSLAFRSPFRGPSLASLSPSSVSSHPRSFHFVDHRLLIACTYCTVHTPASIARVRVRTVQTTTLILPNPPVRLPFPLPRPRTSPDSGPANTPYLALRPRQKLAFCAVPPLTVRMPFVTTVSSVGSWLVFLLTLPKLYSTSW